MTATNAYEARRAIEGGAIAGAIAGALLSVFIAVMATAKGLDVWAMTFKGAAVPFLGEGATRPGFDLFPVLLGAIIHFAISIAWGVLFGLLAYGLSRPVIVLASAVWGLVVWVAMYYVVLPMAGLGDITHSAPIGSGILSHLFFGVSLGLAFLPFAAVRPTTLGHRQTIHGH